MTSSRDEARPTLTKGSSNCLTPSDPLPSTSRYWKNIFSTFKLVASFFVIWCHNSTREWLAIRKWVMGTTSSHLSCHDLPSSAETPNRAHVETVRDSKCHPRHNHVRGCPAWDFVPDRAQNTSTSGFALSLLLRAVLAVPVPHNTHDESIAAS
jgi:hypothetical protein